MSKLTVAVCGATGAVGREMLNTLHQRAFPATEVLAFASSRSAGSKVEFGDQELTVRELKEDSFEGVDIAIFSAGGATSLKFAPYHKGIIANPNCSTIQMLVALKPIYDAVGIKRIVVSTYQAVSGTGQKGIAELEKQVRDLFNARDVECKAYPYQIAFNILPHIDVFLDNDYTKEEMKMVNETRKMFHDPLIRVTATCARVPVFYGHAESVNVETEKKLTARECRVLLSQAPGVRVYDNPRELMYPMPLMGAGKDETFVGRIRDDESIENGLNMWIVADNIRKGAALNAVQIAEELVKRDLVRVNEQDRDTFLA